MPPRRGSAAGPAVRDQQTTAAARRHLGRQLAAWRLKAGLTQRELAYLTGHDRSRIAHAEAGDRASRDLLEAADRALGAGGRLSAGHDAITAATAASETSRRARSRAALLAAGDGPPVPAAAVSTIEGTCPSCGQRLAVRVVVSLLPAVPVTRP